MFILGTTGEGPSLSYRLRRELIERVCRQVKQRVPVLVGITDTAFVESGAISPATPPKPARTRWWSRRRIICPKPSRNFRNISTIWLPELPLPLFLYNMPALTKVHFELETVRRALDEPRIIGLKDSSGDLDYFKSAAEIDPAARPDWSLLIGPEEKLFDSLQLGGHGGVSGGANLFPKLYVQLVEAHRAGNLARAQELQKQIQRVSDSLYRIGKYSSSIIKGIKCALACLGVCDDFMAEPFHRFRAGERELVKARLKEIEAEIVQTESVKPE